MGGLSLMQRLLVLSTFLLLQTSLSLAYSLKNCSIEYSEDALADGVLDCSRRKLVSIPDDIPSHVSSVNLLENLVEQINRGSFGNLSKLNILFLSSNHINYVEDGSFIHLCALTQLYMDNNKLTNLTGKLFQGLSNLTMLSLNENNIQFIHTSAFQFLSSLQTVTLDNNNLQQVSDLLPILQLPHIQKLSIGYTQFSSFETKDLPLNVSSSLKVLDLSNSKLEKFSITTDIFPYLEMINLIGSGIDSGLKWAVPDKTLLRNITQLDFGHPLIAFEELQKILESLDSLVHLRLIYMEKLIHKGILATVCKIPTLKKLVLYFNHVPNLSSQLVDCHHLSELDLSNTYMRELPEGKIRFMKQLRFLTLQCNLLTKVPDDIQSLSSLKILNLGDNLISDLSCNDFINTTGLTELYLDSNHIVKLDRCVFENLNELNILDLSDNLLWTLGGVFKKGLPRLEFLDLSKNNLIILENEDFQALGSLTFLNVVSTHIGRVKRRTFLGLNNLRNLTVSIPLDYETHFRGTGQLEYLTIYLFIDGSFKSPLPSHHDAFYQLKCLKVLTIKCKGYHFGLPLDIPLEMLQAMKHLEEFTAENVYISAPDPETFQFNPQLKSLTIGQTDLSNLLPELFEPIPNLQVLDLSESQIKSLDFLTQVNLPALRCLKLRDNEITVINETIFQSLPALTYLDLENNPFTCDCSNAGFIQWVRSNNQTQVVNGHQYMCSFPVAEQGSKLLDFDIQSCWMDVSFLCFISSSCITLVTLLTSFIYHFLRWQIAYTFHLFLAFLYESRRRKKGAPHQYDAFISYNIHDEAWICREMLPVLEGEQGWKLCLHHRDFQPGKHTHNSHTNHSYLSFSALFENITGVSELSTGKPIIENITDAIYGSRKTICVITRRYLQSEWCSREIQMASFRLLDEQEDVLILIFLEDIPAHQLSPYYRMRKLLKKRTAR
ncbi:Toll-like receptor 13 [Dissostichus eleginoides]|uniref:Toll-like receptor 13 n=1 Tax=Dissostichus eleginoides TaxID=100907 RepID=A0AAD9C6J7_DISEL|nr:Toll-like receptor 13 [Dissostichus eleginoides]